MNNTLHLFFELLQVYTGVRDGLSRQYKEKEWNEVFDMADEQEPGGRVPVSQKN